MKNLVTILILVLLTSTFVGAEPISNEGTIVLRPLEEYTICKVDLLHDHYLQFNIKNINSSNEFRVEVLRGSKVKFSQSSNTNVMGSITPWAEGDHRITVKNMNSENEITIEYEYSLLVVKESPGFTIPILILAVLVVIVIDINRGGK